MSAGVIFFGALGLLCLFYCLAIGLFINYGTKFFLIWGGLAALFGAVAFLLTKRNVLDKIPLWMRIMVLILVVAGGLMFLFVEGMIFSQFYSQAAAGADFLIVLGAQWKEEGPSYILQKRLDKALEYLEENPETRVIVSGGQGSNEPISEAEGMYSYLAEAGIDPERILLEAASSNTYENLTFSGELLDKSTDRVVIVTSNFHVFRAVKIARKQGYEKAEGLAADSYGWTVPNNLLREFFGVVKDCCVGNL